MASLAMSSPQRIIQSEALLRELLDVAIAAAQPAQAVLPHLPPPPRGRTIVLGAGKAAAAMAQAVERHMAGALEGLVVTRYGHAAACARIEVVEAAHPVPDAAGRAAARRILELAAGAGPDDLVLCLISGGASALLTLPAPGLSLDGQAGGQPRAARLGRRHRPDERRAQAPLGDQGRPPRRRGPSGAGREPPDLGRAGRRSGGDRLRADGARSRRPSPTRWRSSSATASSRRPAVAAHLRGGGRRDAEARRSAPRRAPRRSSSRARRPRSRRPRRSRASAASRR